jgi:hypothetical protein
MATGTGTLDFGADPGTDEAAVTITGQTGLISTSHINAWFEHGDSTADNTALAHEEAQEICPLACKWTVDGSFEVRTTPLSALGTGTFLFHYAWSNL